MEEGSRGVELQSAAVADDRRPRFPSRFARYEGTYGFPPLTATNRPKYASFLEVLDVLVAHSNIYRGRDPIAVPAYSIAEASHLLRVAPATVRSWVLGRRYPTQSGTSHSRAVIEIADRERHSLSFRNLVELHVLSAIRRVHGVKLDAVRNAVRFLQQEFGSKHPLADDEMQTDGKDLFVDRYGEVVNVSAHGQIAMKDILGRYLQRIERDSHGVPIRLYPFTTTREDVGRRTIVIDPRVQFGRPCLRGTGTPTSVIAERYTAGDSIKALAADYDRSIDDIEEAVRYELRAA